jgi:transposase-like protein
MAEFLAKGEAGQVLLPLMELLVQTEIALDEVVDLAGRATIEAVLQLSAQELAGPKHAGKAASVIRRHGTQEGVVALAERKLRIEKPRLRRKGQGVGGEVEIPAYTALATHPRLGQRMLEIMLSGVSTRNYAKVLPEMAETVGVSKSAVSREFVAASAEELQGLFERRFNDVDLLVIYLDGLRFGDFHVLVALGVDKEGKKHVLGLREGASENAAVVKDLLTDLVARGINPKRRRLFVIDGSKALRQGIDSVMGTHHLIQRCRQHKLRNVLDYLPKEQRPQVRSALQAAFRLEAKEGLAKLKQLAKWLEQEYPSAASSLREGLEELFTINRMGLPPKLRRCLGSTNVIESPNSPTRLRTRRVCHWQDGAMALRWAASALLATEKNFRKIMGHKELWMLEAFLNEETAEKLAENRMSA